MPASTWRGSDGIASWARSRRAWEPEGLSATALPRSPDLAAERPEAVLDVRDPLEWDSGVLGDPITIHMSAVPSRVAELPSGDVWIYCETGYRAAVAAGFVAASGRNPVVVRDDLAAVPKSSLSRN